MPEEGSPAPGFTLPDQDGKSHMLSNYQGQWVVLYFYPKDDTPGCTKEACGFRDLMERYEAAGAVILGVSADSPEKHQKFIAKYGLPFTLLSDETFDMLQSYGVWQEKSMYGKTFLGIARTTFIINPEGKVAKIYRTVKTADHHETVLSDLPGLQKVFSEN